MDLSIIIVSYNTRNLLRNCLQSIYANASEGDFEVLVIDNASTDGSANMVKEEFPQVELICNEKNLGFAKANNLGIERSNGRHILLLNSDTEVLAGALDGMVNFLEAHPDVDVLGCQLLDSMGKAEESCGFFPTPKAILLTKLRHRKLLEPWFKNSRASILSPERAQGVDWVTGACLMTRRRVVNEVGLLDEKMFMYFEDVDWCYRMKKAGWKIYFAPEVRIIHKRGASLEQVPDRMIYEYRRSELHLYKKHLGLFSQLVFRVVIFAHSFLMICKYGIKFFIHSSKRQELRELLSSHWKIIKMTLSVGL